MSRKHKSTVKLGSLTAEEWARARRDAALKEQARRVKEGVKTLPPSAWKRIERAGAVAQAKARSKAAAKQEQDVLIRQLCKDVAELREKLRTVSAPLGSYGDVDQTLKEMSATNEGCLMIGPFEFDSAIVPTDATCRAAISDLLSYLHEDYSDSIAIQWDDGPSSILAAWIQHMAEESGLLRFVKTSEHSAYLFEEAFRRDIPPVAQLDHLQLPTEIQPPPSAKSGKN